MKTGQGRDGSRRAFVKKACLAGLCACGTRLVNADQAGADESAAAPPCQNGKARRKGRDDADLGRAAPMPEAGITAFLV